MRENKPHCLVIATVLATLFLAAIVLTSFWVGYRQGARTARQRFVQQDELRTDITYSILRNKIDTRRSHAVNIVERPFAQTNR